MSVSVSNLQTMFERLALEQTGSDAQRQALLYQELKQIARRVSGKVQPGQTFQTTAILHEAWERLDGADLSEIHHRRQFMAMAATIMHRVAVDHVRARVSKKRGGDVVKVPLEEAWQKADGAEPDELVLALHEGLKRLMEFAPSLAQLAELLFFVGLTQKEIAQLRGCLLYTSPSPRDLSTSRMPSSA